VWLYDSPALYGDVWVHLALVAEHTTRIGIGPGVLVPNLRHPVTQASAIATVAALAPGRLAVAIGTGFTARMTMGQRPLTWAETRTYIAQVKGLLAGEAMVVDGKIAKLIPPVGYLPFGPVPVLVAANGPKGLAVARELGDGVMSIFGSYPEFDWCALLAFGTVLEPEESPGSERALLAVGPALTVVYHGMYEADPESVEGLPGGSEWRAELERIPVHLRHLATHEDHLVNVPDRDRPVLSGEGLTTFTWTGEAEVLRARLDATAAAGTTEILYQPCGPDVERELRAFMTMASA
jgi:Coenzyme F420-dependent N5,N10-methylene tetrahydromethanopterin reductase and related flavin-dependent oxidoreductases